MIGEKIGLQRVKNWLTPLEKYKGLCLVMLVGAALLLVPTAPSSEGGAKYDTATQLQSAFDLDELEEKLEETLSRIEGAGAVNVVLTLQGSGRQVLATDSVISQEEGARQEEKQAVVVSQGSGSEGTVTLQEIYPVYQGALVVCPGADNPTVEFKLTQAISALTGLGANKISICKAQ